MASQQDDVTASAVNIPPGPDSSTPAATTPVPPSSPTMSGPPASPTSPNRFGLALTGLIRPNRPRGFTLTSTRSPGPDDGNMPSPDERAGNSSGGESGRASYFSMMRSSRRRARDDPAASPGEASDSQAYNTTPRGRMKKSHSHQRGLRETAGRLGSGTLGNGGSVGPPGTSSRSSADDPQPNERSSSVPGHMRLAPSMNTLGASTSTAIVPAVEATAETTPAAAPPAAAASTTTYAIRLVPHLDSTRSLHFQPVERKVRAGVTLKVGRFTDRGSAPNAAQDADDPRIAFKSKVVSRGHADIFTDAAGSFFIKDTKSSSGTFLNHIRLSGPGNESRPFPLRDGDVLQLGVDYQGGTEEMYRCVKMRVELNRDWQRANNNFNKSALAQLRALGGGDVGASKGKDKAAGVRPAITHKSATAIADCCICLFSVTVCQALFIAPCSHVYHYKCIRPLLQMHHPGFACPLCRTFADLEADVETEEPMFALEDGSEEAADSKADAIAEEPAVAVEDPMAADLDTPLPTTIGEEGDTAGPLPPSRRPSARDDLMVVDGSPGAEHEPRARRPQSVIMSGPEGVGIAFNVTPPQGATGRSRPSSVRSLGVAPMARLTSRTSADDSAVDDGDDDQGEEAVTVGAIASMVDPFSRLSPGRSTMSGAWDPRPRVSMDEDEEMVDALSNAPGASTTSFGPVAHDPAGSTATVDVVNAPPGTSILSALRATISRPLSGGGLKGDPAKEGERRKSEGESSKGSSEGSSAGTGKGEEEEAADQTPPKDGSVQVPVTSEAAAEAVEAA